MGCINVREGSAVVRVFDLDNCGNPTISSTAMLALNNISEISWEDQIDEGDQVTERNFGGTKCYTDVGADELENIQVNMTTCGMIPALDSLLMSSDLLSKSSDPVGFGRKDLSSSAAVAIEILIELDADACATGSDLPVFGVLFPLVKNWRPSGGETLDGSSLLKPQYNGKGYKNANLKTAGAGNDELPVELDHWDAHFDPDNHWYVSYVFDATDVTGLLTGSTDCTFSAVTETS